MLAGIDEWLKSSEMQLALSAMDEWGGDDDDAGEGSLEALLEETSERGFDTRALREQAFLGPGEPLPYSDGSGGPAGSNEAGEETAALTLAVASDGVGRVAGALSAGTAAALRAHVLAELQVATDDGASGAAHADPTQRGPSGRLSKVLSPSAVPGDGAAPAPTATTRWDLQLRFREDDGEELAGRCAVRQALREVCRGAVGGAVEALQGGGGAELWELAAIVSAPGAVSQIVHADAGWTTEPLLLTAFVALQPVTRAMGPTRFLPGTHRTGAPAAALEAHGDVTGLRAPSRPRAEHNAPPPSCVGVLNTGDATLYDGRLLHCGTANASGEWRVLFYATFRHMAPTVRAVDPARSLQPSYHGQYQLQDFCADGTEKRSPSS